MSSQHCVVHRPLKRVTHKFIPVVERSVEIISNIELIRYRNTKHTNSFIIKFSNNFGDLFTFFDFYSHHLHHTRFPSILNRTNNVTCSNHSFLFLSSVQNTKFHSKRALNACVNGFSKQKNWNNV